MKMTLPELPTESEMLPAPPPFLPIPRVLVKTFPRLDEPAWAKQILENLQVSRNLLEGEDPSGELKQELTFQLIGLGGWSWKAPLPESSFESAEYVGWRPSGVGDGDVDAWLCIHRNKETGEVAWCIMGYSLETIYKGIVVEPTTLENGVFFSPPPP